MVDRIVSFDIQKVLHDSKEVLRQRGQLPLDCPSDTCLSLESITFSRQPHIIRLDARPPQLPTKREGYRYEIDPVCRERCGISGNENIRFKIIQNPSSGRIIRADSEYR